MRKGLLVLSLFLATDLLAVRLDVKERLDIEPIGSPRKAQVLRDARAAFTRADGSQWITHSAPADRATPSWP
jgi:hypothetical protein